MQAPFRLAIIDFEFEEELRKMYEGEINRVPTHWYFNERYYNMELIFANLWSTCFSRTAREIKY